MKFPTWIKLAIYILIAVLSTLQNEINKLTVEIILQYSWLDYVRLLIALIMPALVTVRAFIDQSITDNKKTDDPK